MTTLSRTLVLGLVLLIGTAVGADAQVRRPRATLDTGAARSIPPGRPVALTVKVTLPEDVHVQSNAPRDASLIPTVLTVEAPDGVTVERITYPPPSDLAQEGQAEPLAVFGPVFEISATVRVAAGTPAGAYTVPLRLRYQACDSKSCYPPARAEAAWTVDVAPPSK